MPPIQMNIITIYQGGKMTSVMGQGRAEARIKQDRGRYF